ncbi:hypothetical protein FY557_14325 [Chryseobacterium sp. SN22]|uniref:hypothetical protein n=1 Tax=Chryseobacterium sp. SN22 TaxID=2606431 RepID=UPI0011ED3F86|nr:hypothetical protein [Chryseobacterium sp. SN22]KAA0127160.1 hypothetical protein FY557_14325 [Chryseobacterium sp. SN22]
MMYRILYVALIIDINGKRQPLFFRLRNLRSRKRIIKKDVEKQIRQKYKHWRRLWEIRRNIPLVPLEKPYQKGFVRFFVLRDDIKRSSDSRFFEELLKKLNTEMYSPTRKFLKKNGDADEGFVS